MAGRRAASLDATADWQGRVCRRDGPRRSDRGRLLHLSTTRAHLARCIRLRRVSSLSSAARTFRPRRHSPLPPAQVGRGHRDGCDRRAAPRPEFALVLRVYHALFRLRHRPDCAAHRARDSGTRGAPAISFTISARSRLDLGGTSQVAVEGVSAHDSACLEMALAMTRGARDHSALAAVSCAVNAAGAPVVGSCGVSGGEGGSGCDFAHKSFC